MTNPEFVTDLDVEDGTYHAALALDDVDPEAD